MRLLPRDRDIGWMPYLWLVYLSSVPVNAALRHAGAGQWAVTIVGMLVFLVLYFRGYWLAGRRLWAVIAAIAALGAAFAPFNPGAAVYFIFAAAFAGNAGPPRLAYRIIGILLAVLALESVLLRLPPYFWIPAAFFTLMIGAVNIYYAERRRDLKKILMAQEETEHMAKIAERERIARDLHDVLGHTLSLIILKSELASKLAGTDPARAIQEIREVEQVSRDALAQVRSTVRGYQSQGLQAEAAQASAALQAAGVRVHCEVVPAGMPPAHEGVLALALREAVTNVIRHAKATSCELRLRQDAASCELEIRDDGCGRLGEEGVGLAGMRRRVEALGGRMLREGGAGTRLLITLPVVT